MLAQQHRLAKESDIRAVLRRGRAFHSPTMVLRVLRAPHTTRRWTVVVGTKVSKKAVIRNKVKRRIRAIVREKFDRFPKGYDYLVLMRQVHTPSYEDVYRDLRTLHSLLKNLS